MPFSNKVVCPSMSDFCPHFTGATLFLAAVRTHCSIRKRYFLFSFTHGLLVHLARKQLSAQIFSFLTKHDSWDIQKT